MTDRHDEISTELSRLLAQQTEFFKKDHPTRAEIQEFKQAGERIRKNLEVDAISYSSADY